MNRQLINKNYYHKNKEQLSAKRRLSYQAQKQQTKNQTYYGAEAYQVLISFKKYTELNKETRKLWLDFNWTLQAISASIHSIVDIMKLGESADNLIRDYWKTAKNKVKKEPSWTSLDPQQKDRLIKYWAREKARQENDYLTMTEQLEQQGHQYEKELELAKFHEERGQIKCPCSDCATKKKIQTEIKKQITKKTAKAKLECPECKKMVKNLEENSGVCQKCLRKYD